MKRTVSDLVKLIAPQTYTVIGKLNRNFQGIGPITGAHEGDLSFCTKKGDEAIKLLNATKASVILIYADMAAGKLKFDDKTLVGVENPRRWFIRAMRTFFPLKTREGIHATAVIGKNCKIGERVYVGAYAFIDDDVEIGNETEIHSGVHIHGPVRIGKNVVIKSGCIIGGDGFGYERNVEGKLEKFPHIGGVVIEDDVEIGSNTCVDKGTLSNTIIRKGTKVDNLVHVAHNVVIGRNCAIIALAMLGGGSRIGDEAWIAPTACIRDGISVGKCSIVGMGAVVTKDVEDGDTVIGVPARSIKEPKK
jgi:UDP-3-O-[3-hydroxymyristoyl] glucosamine N-acyltransferase